MKIHSWKKVERDVHGGKMRAILRHCVDDGEDEDEDDDDDDDDDGGDDNDDDDTDDDWCV